MAHKIRDIEIYLPLFRPETPMYDSSFVLKTSGNVVVRVVTEDGLDGFGMTFPEPVAEYIQRNLKEEVVGRDPLASEDIWNGMFAAIRSSGRKGAALLAMSAIDIAVWDLKGKILGQPVYRLLGGARRKIPAYASVGFLSMPEAEVAEKAIEYVADGYKTLKIKVGYDGGKNIRADVSRVERVRRAVGDEIELIVDANGIYDAATAIRFARAAADLKLALFEEPTHADDIPGLRRVREASGIPIATGENEYTKFGCRDLLLAQAADVLQFDVTRAGGITEMLKISALTQAWNLKLAPHFWPQYSAHLLSPAPHGLYLEVFPASKGAPAGGRIITNQPPVTNGFYEIPDRPGFGLEYDMEYLGKYKAP
ncbi:L-alanine-DL-glutamate epimerase [Sporobacter termitidis DSM 10068]|uniref:L-alanine-DL-glutamate epimerase n=1 Tax=Sporobacter termitidis DSM 10068 TaxID=1123282 RepID=A0A1M5ZE66_9FIRM|nr:mandelate racemase/muconate lactonizing enzyme family protein [Sporobacter termitidis]SHI22520.1 L-alanine-DL-glutamate epimerase [Sporobacter termitidis DSM 10068]